MITTFGRLKLAAERLRQGMEDSYDRSGAAQGGAIPYDESINSLASINKVSMDPRRATTRQRLQQQLADLKKAQAEVEKAIAALDKIPDVEALLDSLRKVGV